jgi:hypothetical protein
MPLAASVPRVASPNGCIAHVGSETYLQHQKASPGTWVSTTANDEGVAELTQDGGIERERDYSNRSSDAPYRDLTVRTPRTNGARPDFVFDVEHVAVYVDLARRLHARGMRERVVGRRPARGVAGATDNRHDIGGDALNS